MSLPNLSRMLSVGELRYIQSFSEAAPDRNPDAAVGTFLSMPQRLACALRGRLFMPQLRAKPFYHYILARTRYYDEVFLDAVNGGVACIVNIGCGSDTRAHRFTPILKQKGVTVVECDQRRAIEAKQRIARQQWPTDHIRYLALDLHDPGWTGLAQLLDENARRPVLVMMEGVSPYISSRSFEAFLGFLAARLDPGSLVAYDFKLAGAAEDFGRTPRMRQPFRLPAGREEVAAYHAALGFELRHMELSAELSRRLAPGAPLLFDRDGLLRLSPRDRRSSNG